MQSTQVRCRFVLVWWDEFPIDTPFFESLKRRGALMRQRVSHSGQSVECFMIILFQAAKRKARCKKCLSAFHGDPLKRQPVHVKALANDYLMGNDIGLNGDQ
jgi:hypothetical protein